MDNVLSWLVTALVGVLLLSFIWALLSLHRLPVGRRPLTRHYDRFGRFQGLGENPDYHENPSETEDDEAGHLSDGSVGRVPSR